MYSIFIQNFYFRVLQQIKDLVIKNEELKLQEIKFKEQCKIELAKLHQEIK